MPVVHLGEVGNWQENERGQVTAFVVVIMVALLALAALVVDGGYMLAANRRAIDEADAAARAGANALDVNAAYRRRTSRPDPAAARRAALDYLDQTGHQGSVTVDGTTVEVTVTFTQRTTLLKVVGMSTYTASGHGIAHAERGTVSGRAAP